MLADISLHWLPTDTPHVYHAGTSCRWVSGQRDTQFGSVRFTGNLDLLFVQAAAAALAELMVAIAEHYLHANHRLHSRHRSGNADGARYKRHCSMPVDAAATVGATPSPKAAAAATAAAAAAAHAAPGGSAAAAHARGAAAAHRHSVQQLLDRDINTMSLNQLKQHRHQLLQAAKLLMPHLLPHAIGAYELKTPEALSTKLDECLAQSGAALIAVNSMLQDRWPTHPGCIILAGDVNSSHAAFLTADDSSGSSNSSSSSSSGSTAAVAIPGSSRAADPNSPCLHIVSPAGNHEAAYSGAYVRGLLQGNLKLLQDASEYVFRDGECQGTMQRKQQPCKESSNQVHGVCMIESNRLLCKHDSITWLMSARIQRWQIPNAITLALKAY